MGKFHNKFELLFAELIYILEDLTFNIYPIFEVTEYSRCTEINNCLNGKIVNLLNDTSSEDTAIWKIFHNDNLEYFKSCPTLPSCGKFIEAATRNKSTRLKLQAMIPTKINNLTLDLIYIELMKDCIIGINSQEKLKMSINTEAKKYKDYCKWYIRFDIVNIMSFIELKQYSSLNIIESLDGENNQKSSHSKTNLEFQDYLNNEFDVSIEEIEQKINTTDILYIEQKQILKRLIIKNKSLSGAYSR